MPVSGSMARGLLVEVVAEAELVARLEVEHGLRWHAQLAVLVVAAAANIEAAEMRKLMIGLAPSCQQRETQMDLLARSETSSGTFWI